MQITTKTIVESTESINQLLAIKLPATISYKLVLFVKRLEPIIEGYNKVRGEKVIEYGTVVVDDEGKDTDQYKFSPENATKFSDELNALLATENELNVPEINIKDLGELAIEPKYLMNLGWLIKE